MNSVTLIGNLGQDPELRYTQSQTAVCNFSLATKGRNDQTDWHRITAWNKTAENVNKYLRKGSKCALRGSISYEKYTDKQGQEKTSTIIHAHEVEFLDSPNQKNGEQGYHQGQAQQSFPPNTGGEYVQQRQQRRDNLDDIPF